MTTTDYVPVDVLKSYIEHFIEESEKQHSRAIKMFNSDDAAYYDGVKEALDSVKEQIDKMKVAL